MRFDSVPMDGAAVRFQDFVKRFDVGGFTLLPFSFTVRRFAIQTAGHMTPRVLIDAEVVDVKTGKLIVTHMRSHLNMPLEYYVHDEQALKEEVLEVFRTMLFHELTETLLFKGEHIRRPHGDEPR